MPTYQYACTECGEQLEVVQKFSDDPLTVCPACSGRLRKVFSAVGVVFKGSGFYKTDSRSSGNGSKPAAKSDGAAKSTGSDSSSSSSSSSSDSSASATSSTSGSSTGGGGTGGSGGAKVA
jgi:putative FmdB family regulatory protein